MIPQFDDGVLPEDIHVCTVEEVEKRFGVFRRTERRSRLMAKLKTYIADVKSSGNAKAIVIDGSFVTAKEEPGDVDILLVLSEEVDLAKDISPSEYNVQSKRMVKRLYGFDVFTAVEGGDYYRQVVNFLMDVKLDEPQKYTRKLRKGVLRIEL